MDRAISAFICLVWKIRSLAVGMGVGVRSMPTGSFGQGALMLQDLKSSVNPKESSLMTHRDASMKMYDISNDTHCKILKAFLTSVVLKEI